MATLHDDLGRPTKLEEGDVILFDTHSQCVSIKRIVAANNRTRVLWFGGDDKKLAPFVRSQEDFRQLASILAETHNLYLRKPTGFAPDSFAWQFVAS